MANDTLVWQYLGNTIRPPFETVVGPKTITITNYGTETLTGLGFYIRPATNQGDVDNRASNPPETDYQDLLTWGTQTALAIDTQGGIKVTLPEFPGGTPTEYYVTRTQGCLASNKILIADLSAGASHTIIVEVETPTVFTSRRMFFDIGIE